jgi:SPP1 family phage portal protein
MFYINKNTELSIELLNKMIHRFITEDKPKLEKNKKYYDGAHAILNKVYSDETKPCSRTITNYCKNIADSYCGYLASPGYISYRSEQDIEDVMDILRYNDFQAEDSDFLLQALVYGRASELMFTDEVGKVRFKLIDPTQCFAVYDDSLTGDLLHFVRMYKANEWDDSDVWNVDVYSEWIVKHYTMNGIGGLLTFVSEEYHFFNQCPANVWALPDEKSIFECIISLQDASNELLSSEIDDYSAFCDAYLTLTGMDADSEDIKNMKENRVLILPQNAQANWLTKAASDAQVENILKRIHESIYRIAACPDFSSESFVGGVSSGIAIQYRLTGMETRAAKICAEMKKALQRRVEIICSIASLKLGEEVFRDIQIEFKRNIPEDTAAIINMINTLKGTVSDATLLSQLDFIQDVNAEIEAVEAQKKANMEAYGLGLINNASDEEDALEDE